MALLLQFAPVVGRKTRWHKVEIMVVGAMLATGKGTVSGVWRVMGLSQDRHYVRYHHMRSRAVWSTLAASAIVLQFAEELRPTQ